uniref:Ribosomal RNA-processing protein 8 n=1 Tax=Lepisosteus oculatus TaxID=7918 RepID=W5N8N3_LEPOC
KDQGQSKFSRKQWKNKMKNKRKRKTNSGKMDKSANGKSRIRTRGLSSQKSCSVAGSALKSQPDEEEIETSGLWAISARKRKKDLKKQQAKLQKICKVLESKITGSRVSRKEKKEEKVTSALLACMEQQLKSARFRFINEQLYTSTSQEAYRMLQQEHQAFNIDHRGFTAQVERWPSNPVDSIISYLCNKPSSMVVADFGCGDCKIARRVKNKVHSFDLLPINDLVTVCDMARSRLFKWLRGSLPLMGTNTGDFLVEANCVTNKNGILMITEVASRFENVRSFLLVITNVNLEFAVKDTSYCYFYTFELIKTTESEGKSHTAGLELKPCMYKKR